jgi:hypothetical protein
MRSLRLFAVLAAAAALAGCHSNPAPPPSGAVSSSPTTSAKARDDAFQSAASALSQDASVPRDSIAGVSQDETTWKDSCLGCAKPGESCAQVLTPGYRVVLRASAATYEYHTDLGGHARLCGQNPTAGSVSPSR